MTEPLIYTTNGNVPIAGLRHEVEWRISDDVIVFIERYFDGEEVVKESSHAKILAGTSMGGIANT